ncbi:hypothetical protein BC361_24930 [Ensifer sp. LC54]|nr:hypothetical protein BC363_28110 [Ensifer sp. LC384]OCP22369.1 hypothetical protein BC361_24930 [Ensifer sp. LC54]
MSDHRPSGNAVCAESTIPVYESFFWSSESNERNLRCIAGTLKQVEVTWRGANGVRESKDQRSESEISKPESNDRNLF